MPVYKLVIRVDVGDPPERRARAIADGIAYACCLLMDEYGWTAERVDDVLEAAIADSFDRQDERTPDRDSDTVKGDRS